MAEIKLPCCGKCVARRAGWIALGVLGIGALLLVARRFTAFEIGEDRRLTDG